MHHLRCTHTQKGDCTPSRRTSPCIHTTAPRPLARPSRKKSFFPGLAGHHRCWVIYAPTTGGWRRPWETGSAGPPRKRARAELTQPSHCGGGLAGPHPWLLSSYVAHSPCAPPPVVLLPISPPLVSVTSLLPKATASSHRLPISLPRHWHLCFSLGLNASPSLAVSFKTLGALFFFVIPVPHPTRRGAFSRAILYARLSLGLCLLCIFCFSPRNDERDAFFSHLAIQQRQRG